MAAAGYGLFTSWMMASRIEALTVTPRRLNATTIVKYKHPLKIAQAILRGARSSRISCFKDR